MVLLPIRCTTQFLPLQWASELCFFLEQRWDHHTIRMKKNEINSAEWNHPFYPVFTSCRGVWCGMTPARTCAMITWDGFSGPPVTTAQAPLRRRCRRWAHIYLVAHGPNFWSYLLAKWPTCMAQNEQWQKGKNARFLHMSCLLIPL